MKSEANYGNGHRYAFFVSIKIQEKSVSRSLQGAKRVVNYLNCTRDLSLKYDQVESNKTWSLSGFVDAAYGSNGD